MTTAPAPCPPTFPHPYASVAFQLVPEFQYVELVQLHELTKGNGARVPFALTDALRKATWAKSAAVEIGDISAYYDTLASDPETLTEDYMARVRFERSLVDLASHLKATLDALAIFTNECWNLKIKGASDRDFKRNSFRTKLYHADKRALALKVYEPWLSAGNQTYENMVCFRDELVHRQSLSIPVYFPRTELGAMPIPRAPEHRDKMVSDATHMSAEAFAAHHMSRLFGLIRALVRLRIRAELERKPGSTLPVVDPEPMSTFPRISTKPTTIRAFRLRLPSWKDWMKSAIIEPPEVARLRDPQPKEGDD